MINTDKILMNKILFLFTVLIAIGSFQSGRVSAQDNSNIYILDRSIDVLTRAGNFRSDKVVPASTGGRLTVLRRVPSEDPSWWPQGVAIQIVSVNGREERPVKTVYVAKRWFDRGASQGDIAQLTNPQEIQEQVLTALTPVVPECEVEVNETIVIPNLLLEPERPSNRNTYSTLASLVQRHRTQRRCANALRDWYRNNSMWKDLSRMDRARLIVNKANTISNQIRLNALVDTCARASGKSNDEVSRFFNTTLSDYEISKIDYTNYQVNCQRFAEQNGVASLDTSLFRERVRDPSSIHPQLDPSLAICIIKRETASTNFDPHSMNYSFCEFNGRNGRPRSTAHGLGQFTQTTFLSLRDSGQLPLSSVESSNSRIRNRTIFREMSTDPDMQIESIFLYINYLLKANAGARIRHMHDQVYSDEMEDWEKAVIAYDQDRASDYIRGVHACRRCYQEAAGDGEAQTRCLSE